MTKVVLIGDLIIDVAIPVRAKKIAQEDAVIVYEIAGPAVKTFGGAGAVAEMLHALGTDHLFLSPVTEKQTIKERQFTGMDGRNPRLVHRIDEDHYYTPTNNEARKLIGNVRDLNPDIVLFSDYGKGAVFPGLAKAIKQNTHADLYVDPYTADWSKYEGADVILPSRAAAERFLVDHDTGSFLAVVVKLDRDGCELWGAGKPAQIGSTARYVRDVTGAGDQFAATLVSFSHLPMLEAVKMASIAAGLQVERQGIQPVTGHELELRAEAIFGALPPKKKIRRKKPAEKGSR